MMAANRRQPLRSAIVFGGGISALCAALALSGAVPGLQILVIDQTVDPRALVDRLPVLPSTAFALLDLIGIDEATLLARRLVSHRVADRFVNWSGTGTERWHSAGTVGRPVSRAPFHQDWLEQRRSGEQDRYEAYALSVASARSGRWPGADPAALPLPDYGLRLDAAGLASLLRAELARRRVPVIAGRLVAIERRDDGGIAALRMEGDRRIVADIVLDCGGPTSNLARLMAMPTVSWADMLPFDRLWLAERQAAAAPILYDDHVAMPGGWRTTATFRNTVSDLVVSRVDSDQGEAAAQLPIYEPLDVVDLDHGRAVTPWHGNMIALGEAAARPSFLGWPGLSLLVNELQLLLELFPGRDMHPLEQAEYNRRITAQADGVRDFQCLLMPQIAANSMEAQTSVRPCSPELEELIAQFSERGSLVKQYEPAVDRELWLSALIGRGIMPRTGDPIARAQDTAAVAQGLARLRSDIATTVKMAPTYATVLAGWERAR